MAEELTVTEFNQRVNSLVSYSDAIRNISVAGEISGYKVASSGHVYFTLKDRDSALNCTLFRFAASRVKFPLKDGLKVTVFGSASYYVKGGSLSFNVESVSPFGKGELQKKLEELTAKLLKEGLFEQDRKRPIPVYPRVIGVVTSATGAVIRDIVDTTARRYPVDILLSPATVQGDDAPASIIRAMELLQHLDVDVIIIGRGGGSKEDLSAFNDEGVVRAVVNSRVPVISAVGHATDKSLTDLAADKYAETPTAAAMLATPDSSDELRNMNNLIRRGETAVKKSVERMRAQFSGLDARLSPGNAKVLVDRYSNRYMRLCHSMDSVLSNMIIDAKKRFASADRKLDPQRMMDTVNQNMMHLDMLSSNMENSMTSSLRMRGKDLDSISGMLEGLDPMKVLARGYSIVKDDNGNVITSASSLESGADITIKMRDGEVSAKVKERKS